MRFSSFSSGSPTALTPPLRDRVLASRSLMGLVSGFSPNGGNRMYSDGGTGECPLGKGKEDCQNPLTVLAANLTGDNLPDPWWFSSTPSWGGTVFLRQIARRRTSTPQNGRLLCRGSTRRHSLVHPTVGEPPFQWEGRLDIVQWSLTVKSKKAHDKKRQQKRKEKHKLKNSVGQNNYSNR